MGQNVYYVTREYRQQQKKKFHNEVTEIQLKYKSTWWNKYMVNSEAYDPLQNKELSKEEVNAISKSRLFLAKLSIFSLTEFMYQLSRIAIATYHLKWNEIKIKYW